MHQEIISKLKEQYNRDIRKQVVKSILKSEKISDKVAKESSYKIINQIFTYIMSELKWSISKNTNNWDNTPLDIISEVFPKIETTQWYRNQQLSVSKAINLEGNFK